MVSLTDAIGQKTLNHPHDVLKRYRTWLDEKLPQTAHLKVILHDLESKSVPVDQICRLMSLHDEWTPEGNSNNHQSMPSASTGFMRQASLPPFLRNTQTQRPVFNFGASVPYHTTVVTAAIPAGDQQEQQQQETVSTPNEGPMSSSSHSDLGDGHAAGESLVLSPSTSPLMNTVRRTGVSSDNSPNRVPSSYQFSAASQSQESTVPNEINIAQATSDDSSSTKAEQLDKLNHRYDRLTRNCQSHKRRLLQLKKSLREAKLLYESTRKERSEVKRQISTFEHLRAAERRLLLGGTVKTAVNLEEEVEEDRISDTSAMDLDSSYENISSIIEADVSALLNDSSTIESSIAFHSTKEDSITIAPVNETRNDSGMSQSQDRDSLSVSTNNVLTGTSATSKAANDIIGNQSRKSIPTGKPFAALPSNASSGAVEEKGFSVSEPKLIDIDKSAVAEEKQQRERAYDSSRSKLPSESKLLSESQLSTPKIGGIEKGLPTPTLSKPNASSPSRAMEQALAKHTHPSVQNHPSSPAAYSSVFASPSQIRHTSTTNLSSPPMLQRENIFTSESIDIEIPPAQARSVSVASTESPIVPAYIGDMVAKLPSRHLTQSTVQNQPISSVKRSKTERASQNDDNGEWPASQESPLSKRRKTGEKLDSQITDDASVASGVTPSPPKVDKEQSQSSASSPSSPSVSSIAELRKKALQSLLRKKSKSTSPPPQILPGQPHLEVQTNEALVSEETIDETPTVDANVSLDSTLSGSSSQEKFNSSSTAAFAKARDVTVETNIPNRGDEEQESPEATDPHVLRDEGNLGSMMEPGETVDNFINKLNLAEGKTKTSPEDSLADRGQKENEANDEIETNTIKTGVTAEKEKENNRREYEKEFQADREVRGKSITQATEDIGTKEVGKVEKEKERAEEKSKGRTYDREKGDFERDRGRGRKQNRYDRRMSIQPGRGRRGSRSRSTSRSRARSPPRRHGTFYRSGQDRNAGRGGRDRRGFDDRRDDARSYENHRNQDNRGSSSRFDTYKPDYVIAEPNIKIKRESSPRPTDRHQWKRSPSPRQSHRQESVTPRQQSQSNSQSSMNNLFTYINPNSSGPQHMHQLTNNASDPNITKFLEMMNVQMQMLPGFNQQYPTGQSLPPPVFNDAFTYIPPTSQHPQPAVPQHHGNQQQDLLSLLPSMLPGMSMQTPNLSNVGMNMPNQQFFVPMGHSPPLPPSQPGAYSPHHMHHPGAHNDASTAHHQFMGYPPVQQHQQNSSIPKMGGMGLGQGQGDWMNR